MKKGCVHCIRVKTAYKRRYRENFVLANSLKVSCTDWEGGLPMTPGDLDAPSNLPGLVRVEKFT